MNFINYFRCSCLYPFGCMEGRGFGNEGRVLLPVQSLKAIVT
jgi:hypothetical protein